MKPVSGFGVELASEREWPSPDESPARLVEQVASALAEWARAARASLR